MMHQHNMLLTNEFESITLSDRMTQALGPAACVASAIFEDFCHNSYNSSTNVRVCWHSWYHMQLDQEQHVHSIAPYVRSPQDV